MYNSRADIIKKQSVLYKAPVLLTHAIWNILGRQQQGYGTLVCSDPTCERFSTCDGSIKRCFRFFIEVFLDVEFYILLTIKRAPQFDLKCPL